jgi:hypothetical protein
MIVSRTMLLLACAALVLVAPESNAQALAERLDEARLAASVQTALATDDQLRPFTVRVLRRGDQMVVEGTVATEAQRQRVAEVAAEAGPGLRIANRVNVSDAARRQPGPLPPRVRARPENASASATPAPARSGEAAASREPAQESVYHTVRSGETLSSISRQHGVSVSQIQRLNSLRGTNIRAGQRLRVK